MTDTTSFYTPTKTRRALELVARERASQELRYGEANAARTDNGTGPDVAWLGYELDPSGTLSATEIEEYFRQDYEGCDLRNAGVTWLQLVREEFAEVAMEADSAKLKVELAQLAALCVAWMEKL